MSLGEILAIGAGLIVGYGVVSWLLDRRSRESAPGEPARPWHEVLGLAPEASLADIDAAYARLVREHSGDERREAQLARAYREAFAARR